MTTPNNDDAPDLQDVIEPEGDALPDPIYQGHAGMPEHLDDEALAAATEQERVAAGLTDYAPGQVPPATDPLPEDASEAADRAQRGLLEEDGTA
ncbi:hypothetical protein [Kocuria rosea]|uniref:hypothetical protein n=1 Tax=Kocuria rosea TaxID=1275 RepID=UPI002541BEF0|nr:hypothetical protein [Kocuria rosea]WIG15998.1 hypothetical protein QOY29_09785 [Kocuria rosea]